MRGDGLGAEVVLVPVRDEDRLDAVVGRLSRLEPPALVRRTGGIGRDAVANRRSIRKSPALDSDEHAGVGDVADGCAGRTGACDAQRQPAAAQRSDVRPRGHGHYPSSDRRRSRTTK